MKKIFCIILFVLSSGISIARTSPEVNVIRSYPLAGSTEVHPYSKIGITFSIPLEKNAICIDSFFVEGNSHGRYSGTVALSEDGKTFIFTPTGTFAPGEVIHLRLGSLVTKNEKRTPPFSMIFSIRNSIASKDNASNVNDWMMESQLHPYSPESAHSEFPADIPQMNVLVNDNPSKGELFIGGLAQSGPYGAILNNSGGMIKYLHNNQTQYDDFRPNQNGTYSFFDTHKGMYFILDTNFSVIDSVSAPPQYMPDGHEIRFTAEGNRIIIANDQEVIDMSKLVTGGKPHANIIVPLILEFDKKNNLIFQWNALDHFKITDATFEDLTVPFIDFCHINAIEFDGDSNLLISSRNMDEITKIDRQTGNIIWRWGGKNNQFQSIGDTTGFSHQHSIRRTQEGTYSMFDNGYFRTNQQQFSRAVEYKLDTVSHTAEEIWEFRHTPDLFTASMGYVERLPEKRTLIGWGDNLKIAVTEVDSLNKTHFEMAMPDNGFSYRAYKYDSNYVHGPANNSVVNSSFIGSTLACMPNPIHDQAEILYSVIKSGNVRLSLYDQIGREVANIYSGDISPGEHSFMFNCKEFPAGIYYLRAGMQTVKIIHF